jgi:hypothetical protein
LLKVAAPAILLGMRAAVLFAFGLVLVSSLAGAQRRDGEVGGGLELKLPVAVRFGAVLVASGRYRVSVGEGMLALALPESMVTVANVPVLQSAASDSAELPEVFVREVEGGVEIVVFSQDRIFTARGEKADAQAKGDSLVELAGKRETAIGSAAPVTQDELAALDGALRRFMPSISHCGDKAHRSRWATDDLRFQKCVCPLLEKWRLPKTAGPLRLHRQLIKSKNGVSFTVGKDGRAGECRVWSGARSPEEQATSPSPAAPAAAPAPAPGIPPAPR